MFCGKNLTICWQYLSVMKFFFLLINLFFFGLSQEQEIPEHTQDEFRSPLKTLKVLENSTIHIPCALRCMEGTPTSWYRNGEKIAETFNNFNETPTNVECERNHSLKISNIKRNDSGEYSCEVIISEDKKHIRQNHLVNVLYPPVVYPDPSTGKIDIQLGQGFIFICDVIGNPQPKIKWYFQNREIIVKNEHMVVFNISKTSKQHAGEYQCVADNNVGRPASAIFQLRILFHPEIEVENSWIHGAIGVKAELTCTISGTPKPKVDWFFEGMLLNSSSRIGVRVQGSKNILTIKNPKYVDFGNYSCSATNLLGRNIKHIQISGFANPAVFKHNPRIRSDNSYTLIWEVDSYSPLIQYNLRFRRQQKGDADGRWVQLIIPADNSHMGPIHSEMYTLDGLDSATVYEATLSSRNEFGWSEHSNVFKFATVGTDVGEVSQGIETTPKTITNSSIPESAIKDLITNPSLLEDVLWLTNAASRCYFKISLILSFSIISITI